MTPAGAVDFRAVSVGGLTPVWFALDPTSEDPISRWMTIHGEVDDPPLRLAAALTGAGARVVDVGAHLGTFTLSLAALGAEVLAIEGSPRNARLLAQSVERNGFDRVTVVNGVCGSPEDEATVSFLEHAAWGHRCHPATPGAQELAVVTVDALAEQRGWDRVDLVKLDIEGSEPEALQGMRRLLETTPPPVVLIEVNVAALAGRGHEPAAVLRPLTGDGYTAWLLDRARPGALVLTPPDTPPMECVADVLCVGEPFEPPDGWYLAPAFTRDEIVSRLLTTALDGHDEYRRFAAQVMVDGPDWLHHDAEVQAALRALSLDEHPLVRAEADRGACWQGALDGVGERARP
jgi:FkbM family methyltransferase